MQLKWPDLLFVRLLLPYLAGLIIGNIYFNIWLAVILFSFAFVSYAWLHRKNRPINSVFISIAPATVGFLSSNFTNSQQQKGHYLHNAWQAQQWIIEVSSPPKVRPDLISFEANMINIIGDSSYTVTGKLMVYLAIPNGYPSPEIHYGDKLTIPNSLSDIKPPANPYEFDYKNYLSHKGITQQAYLYPRQWKKLWTKKHFDIMAYALQLRQQCTQIIYSQIPDSSYAALVNSMLLGDRSQLTDDTTKAFSITGAMHVLAISGLHVGILYGLLQWLLLKVSLLKRRKGVYVLLVIILLWAYALLTGLSPSVLRATVMASFLIIGDKLMPNKAHPLNSLAASALFLLLIDPRLIHHIGFWLSYSAVVGILLMYKPIYKAIYLPNRVLKWFWQLTSVSVAAQLSTLPITMYVFHQLPVYSMLTNFIVIPATTMILGLGISLLIVNWVPYVSFVAAKLLYWLLGATVYLVEHIALLPGASIRGIYLNAFELTLWVALIASVTWWVNTAKAQATKIVLLVVFSLLAIDTYYDAQQNQQQKLTIYSMHGGTAIDLFNGRTSYSYMDSTTIIDTVGIERKIMPNRWASGISELDSLKMIQASGCKYFYWQGLRMAVLGKGHRRNIPQHPLQVDLLLLTDNSTVEMEYLEQCFIADMVVLDRSNSPKRINKWIGQCEMLGIKYHDASTLAYQTNL